MRNTKQQETTNTIKTLEIPKTKLARRAGVESSRVSEYIQGKSLPTATMVKIESAVEDIARVWTSLGIKTDLDDTEGFAKLLTYVNSVLAGEQFAEIAKQQEAQS